MKKNIKILLLLHAIGAIILFAAIFLLLPEKSSSQITIKVVLSGVPNHTTKLVPCDLKFNKWGHFDLTFDDRGTGALDAIKVTQGGVATNGITYPPITFTDGAGVTKYYTFSSASNAWVNTDSTGDWHFAASFYMDWPQMATVINANWSVLEHGAFHGIGLPGAVALGFDVPKNCYANRNYIYRKSAEQGTPYVTRFGVVPTNDPNYHSTWEQMGYVGGTSENQFDGYPAEPYAEYIDTGLANVTNFKNDDRYHVQARNFYDLTNANAVAYYKIFLDGLLHQSTSSTKMSLDFGIHAFQIDTFKVIMDYLHDNANDHIWVCGLQELYEYFQTIQQTRVKQWTVGDTLWVTLDQSFLNPDHRWRDMSFTLSSNRSISSVTVTGADDYSYNTSTGLINIYKKKTSGFSMPPYYDAMGLSYGKVPLEVNDFYIDNDYGYKPTTLIDGSTATRYTIRDFDGAMAYSPYEVVADLSDYGVRVDSVRIYRSGNSAFSTDVILTRNDNEAEKNIGNWTSGSGWITFSPDSGYVASKLILRSNSMAGFGNELEVYGRYYPYTEQTYAPRRVPLGQMLGVNTYVWNFMPSGGQRLIAAAANAVDSLHLGSMRFYDNANFYPQNFGATYSFDPLALNYHEDKMLRQLKIRNPKLVRFNVIQGQTDVVKQDWRNNPDNTYQIKAVITSYVDHIGYGELNASVYFTAGAGGQPSNWRIENLSRSAANQYPEGTPVTIPSSLPSPVMFFVGPGLTSTYQVGDTIWARLVYTSQINIMYGNNTNSGRATLNTWDSTARIIYPYAARRGRDTSATKYLPYPGNNDSLGLNLAEWGEVMNEPNPWWDRPNYLNGARLGPAWSKIYDNHKTYSTFLGMRNADTSMKLSASGLATATADLNRSADVWSKKNRGNRPKEIVPTQPTYWRAKYFGWVDNPYDIIQFHDYSYTGGINQFTNNVEGGLPIELGISLQALDEFVWFRNKYAPWALVDIGEWGYDLNQSSPMNAPPIGPYTKEQTNGYWSIRYMLVGNVHGADRSQYYRLSQDVEGDSTNATQFSTMSLIRYMNDDTTNVVLRMTGRHFGQLSEFGDYVYDSTLREDSIYSYRFTDGTHYMYCAWTVENPTNVGSWHSVKPTFAMRALSYTFPIANGTPVTVRGLQDNGIVMSSSSTTAGISGFTTAVDSKPVFIQTAVPPDRFIFYYKGGLKYVHH
jgi:hypothetical protein